MSRLYLRDTELVIVPFSGESKALTGLRMSFRVEKTNESTPNTAEVNIYNLSEGNRSLFEGKNTRIELSAGYQDTKATIFQGNVTKAVHQRDGVNIVTVIEVGDGDNRFRNSRIDQGFPPGSRTDTVFNAISEQMGMPISSKVGIPKTQYANGLTLSGYARNHLDDLCRKNDLEWSIQDETIQIVPAGKPTLDSIVYLSADSGLLGSPNKTAKGVEFTSLLQPTLRPGRRVQIKSKRVEGIFKVRRVIHDGDSDRDRYVSECEATG